MADLTVDDLLKRINQDPTLQAVFSGSKTIETVGNRHHIVPSGGRYTIDNAANWVALTAAQISNISTFRDGNTYNLAEVNAGTNTPGVYIQYWFDNVSSFQQLTFAAKYIGTSTHWLSLQLLDTGSTYRTVYQLQTDGNIGNDGTDFNVRTIAVPNAPQFINAQRRVTFQIIHNAITGNTGHDLWIDYLALIV